MSSRRMPKKNVNYYNPGRMSLARDRIRLNVGGQLFETTKLTLTRLDGTIFKKMLEDRCSTAATDDEHGDSEIFIDRDPTHFRTILNFLRDGKVVLPSSEREIEELKREAEFYCIRKLLDVCCNPLLMQDEIEVGDTVGWRPEVTELYWRAFARFCVDENFEIPFVYDENGNAIAECILCSKYQEHGMSTKFNSEEEHWKAISHSMQLITGTVTELHGKTCCTLKWNNVDRRMHVPITALRKITSKHSPKQIM